MRLLAILFILAGSSTILAGTASADGMGGSDNGGSAGASLGNGTPEAVVVVGSGGQSVTVPITGTTPGTGPTWQCQFVHATGQGIHSEPFTPEPGTQALYVCYDTGRLTYLDTRTYNPTDPLAGLFAQERALTAARQRINPPTPTLRTNPTTDQLVGVPTWLWLDTDFTPTTATATVATTSATVTATPQTVTWNTGDGTTLTCTGPGQPFTTHPNTTTNCSHTYTHRSTTTEPNGTYTLQATVTYTVTWTSTTGNGGNLGTITRTNTTTRRVLETQATIQ